MKKTLSLILVAFGVFCLAQRSEAGALPRGPKETKAIGYSTAFTTVTATAFVQATLSTSTVPGAVYAVYLGTGTAGDYCILYDTNVVSGLTAPAAANVTQTAQLGPRLFYGSTSATSSILFDPPLIFFSGLYAACTSATDGGVVEYETGRGLSGN